MQLIGSELLTACGRFPLRGTDLGCWLLETMRWIMCHLTSVGAEGLRPLGI